MCGGRWPNPTSSVTNISVYLMMSSIAIPASSHFLEAVWNSISILVLALLGFLLTGRAYEATFTAGGKLQ